MASLLGAGNSDDDDVARISKYYSRHDFSPCIRRNVSIILVVRYFKEHDLEEFLVKMLMELGKVAPADPLDFMHVYFI